MSNKLVGLAALFSAGLASICCIGPVVLAGLGAGSLGLAAGLAQYRPAFLGLTAIVLAAGFYYAYRRRPDACAGGSCEARPASRRIKTGLWGLAALAAALATFPTWSARVLAGSRVEAPADAKALTLKVSAMTCEACVVSIEKSVEKVPGVYSAQVDFGSGRATIKAKDEVEARDVLDAVRAAGYEAELMEEGADGSS